MDGRSKVQCMPKLLVTGASGFLGGLVCQAAQTAWQVIGTYQVHPVHIAGSVTLKLDLSDRSALSALMATVQPDAVVHAAALSKPNDCQMNPALSWAVNVQAALDLADLCAAAAIPCVFTSTDQVFGGEAAPYVETDAIAPVNLYGEHKALAEQGMRQRHDQVVVCRLPLLYGVVPHARSFIQPFIETLRAGGSLNLFVDETRTPAWGEDVAQGILLGLQHQLPYLHLGGPEALTRYEMGQILVDLLQGADQQIQPCSQAEVPMSAPRPANVALDSTLAYSLGYRPRSFRSVLPKILAIA